MKRTEAETAAWKARIGREAQRDMTPSQRKLWLALKALNQGWRSEYWIEGRTKNGGVHPYRIDIYHPATRLAVEVDGGYHQKTRGRDRRRGNQLRFVDVETLRFTNERVDSDFTAVFSEIQEVIHARGTDPSTSESASL